MDKSRIWFLSRHSFMGRLLWPVNIISFVLIFSFSLFMAFEVRNSAETTTRQKAESVAKFLQSVGQAYIGSPDHVSLYRFTSGARADGGLEFAIFYDRENRALTEDTDSMKDPNIERLERTITDNDGKILGKIVVGYSTSQFEKAFWTTMKIASVVGIGVQFLLSLAIFLVCRNIVRPLNESLMKLSKTTSVLGHTSEEVSKFSESLSSGVSQQAEVVQETTSAMAEMSSTLKQTSNYAKQSETVMTNMTQTANNGMNIMNQMVDAMTSVQHANEQLKRMVEMIQEISNKTNVINDIVFKTQLLSFNASIEAARAGQHGRGFAVVAEEVGNLAKMSGKAAQEIGALLLDSERQVNEIVRNTSERVQVGKSVTEQALRNFKEIAREIDLISSRIGNITTASREQELGVAQTTEAMRELTKTTELNSQVAQKSSNTSGILQAEIKILNSIAYAISESIVGRKASSGFTVDLDMHERISVQKPSQAFATQDSIGQRKFKRSPLPVDIDELSKKIVEMAKRRSDSGEDVSEENVDPLDKKASS